MNQEPRASWVGGLHGVLSSKAMSVTAKPSTAWLDETKPGIQDGDSAECGQEGHRSERATAAI